MDRFVIRGSNNELGTTRSPKKGYKQMSLHSLKYTLLATARLGQTGHMLSLQDFVPRLWSGILPEKFKFLYVPSEGVVVMEDIAKLNQLLRVSNQEPAVLLNSLEKLSKKLPSREILKSTKIGHAIKRLTSHSDKRVSQLARCVISSWNNHFEEKLSKPSLDVCCDRATTESRATVRKHITAALMTDSEQQQSLANSAAESLEFELFRQHRQLMTNSYRRTSRRLVFSLRRNEALRHDVLENKDCRSRLVTELRCGREVTVGLADKPKTTEEPIEIT